ncbi:Uncharacterised protein [Mycobacteroides abscessus subsp. abscessus]|nr:Uncharacterised protein [Mycobacteroides abscessus subsp. abscessus]
MAYRAVRDVFAPGYRAVLRAQCVPESVTGMRQPQVQIVMRRECVE